MLQTCNHSVLQFRTCTLKNGSLLMCKTYFHFQLEEPGEQILDEDNEPLHATTPTRPASPSLSLPTTANARNTKAPAGRNTKPPVSKKSKIDDLLVKFLDRPSPADVLSKQVFHVNTICVRCTLYIVCLQLYFSLFVLLYFTVNDM